MFPNAPIVTTPAAQRMISVNFGGNPNPVGGFNTGFIPPPTNSKTMRWLGKMVNDNATEQNKLSQAIFLAESPADAVKQVANMLGRIKQESIRSAETFRTAIPLLRQLGIIISDKEADDFIYRNARKLTAEIQALYLKHNSGAYKKLKKLGGLKGTVSRKARRIYRKRYSGRRRR